MSLHGHPLLNRRCTRLPGCIRLRNDLFVSGGALNSTHCRRPTESAARGDCPRLFAFPCVRFNVLTKLLRVNRAVNRRFVQVFSGWRRAAAF